MPVIGRYDEKPKDIKYPKAINHAFMLTYERPGLLSFSLESFFESEVCSITVVDDGSKDPEKLLELDMWERQGVQVWRLPHQGLVQTWSTVFSDIRFALETGNLFDNWGILLLEDDVLFEEGWDDVLLRMARGTACRGLKPGSMTCFRCHDEVQNEIVDLEGIEAYQSMQHGFQINLVPAEVFRSDFWMEAVSNSESGRHGIDVWFISLMAHKLGRTSMMSCLSKVAHTGGGKTVAGKQGYRSFDGCGYGLSTAMTIQAAEVSSAIQMHP